MSSACGIRIAGSRISGVKPDCHFAESSAFFKMTKPIIENFRTWPRNLSTSQGGGRSNSQYGGMSTSQYGGMSTSQYGGMSTSQYGGMSTSQYGGLSTSQYGGLSTSQYGGLSTSQYGGLYTSQHGGLSTSPGGGMSTSQSEIYRSNIRRGRSFFGNSKRGAIKPKQLKYGSICPTFSGRKIFSGNKSAGQYRRVPDAPRV